MLRVLLALVICSPAYIN